MTRIVRHVATVTRLPWYAPLQDLAMLAGLVVLALCVGAMCGLGLLSCVLAIS